MKNRVKIIGPVRFGDYTKNFIGKQRKNFNFSASTLSVGRLASV